MALNLVQGKQIATASWAINALTASYLEGYISPFPFTGSATISGSLVVTGAITATQGISGSFSGSGADLFNIPSSGIVGLDLSRIATGSVTASVSLGPKAFNVNSASIELLTVQTDGRVGIGTSTPTSTLDVNSTEPGNRAVRIRHLSDITGSNGVVISTAETGSSTNVLNLLGGGQSLLFVRSDGLLGIGSTSPQYKLSIAASTVPAGGIGFGTDVQLYRSATGVLTLGAGNTLNLLTGSLQVSNTTVIDNTRRIIAVDGNSGTPAFRFSSDSDTGMYRIGTNILGFATNGQERVRIGSTGNLGVTNSGGFGLLVPSARLHTVGIGNTSSTTNLLLQNSSLTNLLTVTDDGTTILSGSLDVTSGITGSLFGTSSWAISSSNALSSSFASTASFAPNYLPLSGGTITGSLTITNDLIVIGSASIQYISESTLNIGTNLITVNTFSPSVRFGGLAVIDSGSSPVVSASFLYDSQQDEFIFVHRGTSASAITSSHFLLGPETYNDLGNELYLTANRIPKGTGIEHLNDSNISDDGSVVSINSNSEITGSLTVTQVITGSLFGTSSFASTASFVSPDTTNAFVQGGNLFGETALLGTNDNQSLALQTSGSVRMFISSSGNVGIGTSTPANALEIRRAGIAAFQIGGNQGGAASQDGVITLAASLGHNLTLDTRRARGPRIYSTNSAHDFDISAAAGSNLILNSITGSVGGVSIGIASSTGVAALAGKLDILDTTFASGSAKSGSILNLNQTWNTTGTPSAIKLNVTNTTSGTTSKLLDLQVGGVSQVVVDKSGNTAVGLSTDTSTARLQVRGTGATSATNTLILQNSSLTNLLTVRDDGSSTLSGSLIVNSPTTSSIPLAIVGASSQSSNLQEWRNSSNAVITSISSTGRINTTGTITSTDNTPRLALVETGGAAGSATYGVSGLYPTLSTRDGLYTLRIDGRNVPVIDTGAATPNVTGRAGMQWITGSIIRQHNGTEFVPLSIPFSGSTNQVLAKNTNTNYDASWKTVDKTFVGLGNVDNTSDIDKPVSTAQAAAIALKADLLNPIFTGSLTVSGSTILSGSLDVANGITGSLFGTSSFASTASFVSPDTTNAFVQSGNSFGTTALLGTNDNQSLALETSGSTRMFISSSGNIGINQINPTAKLHIADSGSFGGSTSGSFIGLHLETLTTASVGLYQNTPSIRLTGYSFQSPSSSITEWNIFGQGSSGATNSHTLVIRSNTAGTLQTPLTLTQNGTLIITNAFSAFSLSTSAGYTYANGINASTSGTTNSISTTNTFNPTSGTAVVNYNNIAPTINQTGGANGITRGIFINPTLTAAADFRALENVVGNNLFNSTSGNTYVGLSTNTGTARLQVRGTGATSATNTFLLQNSSLTNLLTVRDDGSSTLIGRLNITPTTSTTSSLVVTGPTLLSGSQNTISGSVLTVVGSGSAQPVFTVQGSQGELFSVTDSLSGSLFSVNDISGLPIVEVFSDGTTLMGNYLDPMLVTTAKNVLTNSGSFTIYSLPTASYDTAFFDYSVRSGSNARAGQIMAIQSASVVNYTETTTTDFGLTSGLSLGVFVSGSNMVLTGSAATTAWTIKTIIRSI